MAFSHFSTIIAMCRYGDTRYKEPFVCFACRKVFKQTSLWDLPENMLPAPGEERIVLCPQCRAPMADIGLDFKAPARTDTKGWEKVRLLYDAGFTFHSCGCCGPGYRPEELRDVYEWIESNRAASEGERLLKAIDAASAERRRRG